MSFKSDDNEYIKALKQELADTLAALNASLTNTADDSITPKNGVTSDQQLHILNQFAKDLIRLSSSQDLIWHTVNEVVGKMGFMDCVIYLIDEEKNLLVQRAAYGAKSNKNNEILNTMAIPMGKGISGYVAESREALIIPDTQSDDRYIPDLSFMLSEICVPIIDKGRVFGVIDCENKSKNHFTNMHLELLSTIASMLASRLAQWDSLEKLGNAQINLAESEEKYRLLFEKSEDPMMLLTENKFELCNEAAARVFKYSHSQDMQNIHPSQASPPNQPDGQSSLEKAEQMMQIAITNGVHRFEWIHRKKTGEDFPMEVTLTRVPYKGKSALYAVCRDITERKKMDVALRLAITNANEANQTKIKFLANMSHELRTPLNAIMGFSEMMTEKIFGPLGSKKYEDYAESIQTSAKYLSNLINDILALSAINAVESKSIKSDLNINEIVRDCYIMVEKLAFDKKVNCTHKIETFSEPVFANAQELKQILINLLTNAVKFTPIGGSVCLSIYTEDDHHVFEVADTGYGIPQARLHTITDRFDRGQLDPFQAIEGTGLGLAIVKSLIELHTGTLKIHSTEGKGTTVIFTLPLKSQIKNELLEQMQFQL